jgi:tetratricopeptide (TPR) repeat protein
MAKGLALTLGLNSVDPKHYQGWVGKLQACEADARDMADIARAQKLKAETLLTRRATRGAVLGRIARAARTLRRGDLFLLTYSGHGGQVPDRNDDEPDAQDETWCLYDGELIDDELYAALGKLYRKQKKFDDAKKYIMQALRWDPHNKQLRHELALTVKAKG